MSTRETHTRKRIREAVESRGYHAQSIEWEPVRGDGTGGWTVILDEPYVENTWPGDEIGWCDVEGLLAIVDYWLEPEGACACDRSHDPIAAARQINDPEKPTHGPGCRFHIRYRLRSWGEHGSVSR